MKTFDSRKRWWLFFIVGLLAASPVFGGGNGGGTQPTEQPQISWFDSWSTRVDWSMDTYVVKEYAKQMDNAIIDIMTGDSEKLTALIAAGDVPDLMGRRLSRTQAIDVGMKGVLYPLDTKFDQLPSINKWRKTYKEYDANMVAPDGHQYFLPRISGYPYFYSGPVISPLVKKYGVDPAKGDIETFDDLYEILKKFKNDYPDSYPWVTRRGFGRSYREGCNMFGTHDLFYLNPELGDYSYGPMEENYRLMVEYMAKCYKEGLMHPDWFTMEEDPWRETMEAGKAFFTVDAMSQGSWMGGDTEDTETWWIPFLVPKFHGKRYYTTFQFWNVWPNPFFMVGAKSEHVDSIVKFLDWFYSDEGQVFIRYGKAGETSTKQAEGCYALNIPEGKDRTEWLQELGIAYMFTSVVLLKDPAECPTPESIPLDKFTRAAEKMVVDNNSMLPPMPVLSFTDDEFDQMKQIQTDLDTAAMENTILFIRGLKPLSDWDKYIQELKKLGVDEALKIHRAAYKRYQDAMK